MCLYSTDANWNHSNLASHFKKQHPEENLTSPMILAKQSSIASSLFNVTPIDTVLEKKNQTQ
jgi:hypothetical protein